MAGKSSSRPFFLRSVTYARLQCNLKDYVAAALFGAYPAALGLHGGFRYGEAYAAAPHRGGVGLVPTVKALKKVRELGLGEAAAGV